jgi:hypothetical protein
MIEIAKRDSGRVAVIVPHGVLFRGGSEGQIRKALIPAIQTLIALGFKPLSKAHADKLRGKAPNVILDDLVVPRRSPRKR